MSVTFPGTILGKAVDFVSGTGTYTYDGLIYASLSGNTSIKEEKSAKILTVTASRQDSIALPRIGDVVICKVLRMTYRQAHVALIAVGDKTCAEGFVGIIRVQDIRATEKDKIKIASCFRPMDIVRAIVLSLGENQSYLLSTARNDLGVIYATTSEGYQLYPINWKEMKCAETGQIEERKCAKPDTTTTTN